MSPNLARILAPTVMLTRVIWFALTSAIPVYVVVSRLVTQGAAGGIPQPALLATVATLAIGLAVAALFLPRVYPTDGLLAQMLQQEQSPEAVSLALAPGSVNVEKLRELDAVERRLVMVAPVFRAQTIVRSALAEGIGVLGLVLVFLTRNFLMIAPFATLSLVILLLGFPRIEPMVERARSLARP